MRKYIIFILTFFLLIPLQTFAVSGIRAGAIYSSYFKGLAYFNEGKYKDSLKEFKTVESLDSKSSYLRVKTAFVLIKLNRMVKAEEELKKAQELDPQNLEASLGLIFLYSYAKQNKKLEAEYGEFLEEAHKLRPGDLRISEYLAQFYFYKDRIDDAIRIYEAIVKLHPKRINASYLLGYFYEEKGEHNKSIQIWKKVLKDNPSHAQTLNALGYIYAEEGIHLKQAEKMIKKALKSDPNNGAYLDSLGWAYFKGKKYKKAQEYLKKAITNAKDPSRSEEHTSELQSH